MASEYISRTSRQQSVLSSAIRPLTSTSIRARSIRARPLTDAVAKILASEFAGVAATAYVASFLYHYFVLSKAWPPASQYNWAALVIALLVAIVSLTFHHFESIQTQPRHRFLWNGLGAVVLAFSLFLTTLFLFKVSEDYSRGSFFTQALSVAFVVVAIRAVAFSRLQSAIAAGSLAARRVILIGDDELCSHFAERLKETGIITIGSFDFPNTTAKTEGTTEPGTPIRSVLDLCRSWHPDDIIILAGPDRLPNLAALTGKLSALPLNVHVLPRDTIDLLATSRIAEFGNLSTFQVSSPPLTSLDMAIKRTFDLIAAAAGLVLFSPLFLFLAAAIKLDSPGPVLFRQTRHGYNNQTMRIFKFRSLTTIEDGSDFKQVQRNDSRITRIGRILRKTNLDELPQLINVLLGEMSIVGPRPHATAHNEMFADRIPPFARRHNVKPGITGWAQVNGARGPTQTLEKMQERIDLDLYYIDNWSFLFDVKIIVMTLFSKRSYLNAC